MDILSKDSPIIDVYEYIDNNDSEKIINTLEKCFNNELCSQTTKCNLLSSALALRRSDIMDYLFSHKTYGLKEILRTCFTLDTNRYVKQLEKKYENAQKNPNHTNKTLKRIQWKINKNKDMDQGMGAENGFSLTKSKINKIKNKWIKNISEDDLKLFALSMPVRQWQRLSDILHISPKDFQLDWFLDYVYDPTKAPKGSVVYDFNNVMNNYNEQNMIKFLTKHKLPYKSMRSCLLDRNISLTNKCKDVFTCDMTNEDYLWYWEELKTELRDKKLIDYINEGGELDCSYGKLMERLLTIRNNGAYTLYKSILTTADTVINRLKLNISSKVVVLADASASMQVAINTGLIIASSLSVICNAEIRLFRNIDELLQSPTNAQEVIEMSKKHTACASTSPASSLYPYYKNKTVVDIFVIVTDEEENTDCFGNWSYGNDNMFAPLFERYLSEVNADAKLVFVSFTKTGIDGQMIRDIKNNHKSYAENVLVFKLDTYRPDLAKLDKIISQISSLTVKNKEDEVEDNGKLYVELV